MYKFIWNFGAICALLYFCGNFWIGTLFCQWTSEITDNSRSMPNINSISCNNSPINCTISKTSPRSDEAETSRIKNVEELDVSRNNDLVELSREEDGELCSKQILDVGQLSTDSVSKRENNLDFEMLL